MVCGDGTTGVVVLAAELLREAEQLVEKNVHPQVGHGVGAWGLGRGDWNTLLVVPTSFGMRFSVAF